MPVVTVATFISGSLGALALLLSIPILVLLTEVVAAIRLPQRSARGPSNSARPRVSVLVPAHNESARIVPTLTDVLAQMGPGDRLLVVADNCSDDTASAARAAGAEVIERHDETNIGKGHALDFGIRHLSAAPPEVVIVVDADCRL